MSKEYLPAQMQKLTSEGDAAPAKPAEENEEPKEIVDSEMAENGESEDGTKAKKPYFFGPKKPLNAVQRREKKAKQNRRLRKLLTPKNAVIALNELKKGQEMSEYVVTGNGTNFTAEIVINSVKYEATGPSKSAAKMKASEKALRDLVITQMAKAPKKPPKNGDAAETVEGAEDADTDVEMTNVAENEDVPMLHLASFALHKLFTEWQAEGFEIPDYKPPKSGKAAATAAVIKKDISGFVKEKDVDKLVGRLWVINKETTGADVSAAPQKLRIVPKILKTLTDLPADASSRHPSSLLAFMRPHAVYQDLGVSGQPPVAIYTFGVSIDDQQFMGKGRSKKAARKEAAAEACSKLFGVSFPVEAVAAPVVTATPELPDAVMA